MDQEGYIACNSCLLASAASTLSLQGHILALSPCPGTILEQYLSTWSSSADTDGIPDSLPGKQSFWDTPSLLADHARIESSLVEQSQGAKFLASQVPHSGAWLLALPVANCGMRLDDEAVRVAVSMRLGLRLCIPHECRCGTLADAHESMVFTLRHGDCLITIEPRCFAADY